MKFVVVLSVASMLVSVLAAVSARGQDAAYADADAAFRAFLARLEHATSRFINGDTALWKQHASRRDDVTLMGGWGTYERGWTDVGARYDWAGARFGASGAVVKVEVLSSGVSGDLGYAVTLERSVVRLADRTETAPMVLRVTQIFRREAGTWMLIHRHADPLVETTTPASVLKK
jgi:SnoaL-like protein